MNQIGFPMIQGRISIDKKLFEKGIVKAAFDMTFVNTLDADRKMYWKGLFIT